MKFDRIEDWEEASYRPEVHGQPPIIRALAILGGWRIGVNWSYPDSVWLVAPNGAHELIAGTGEKNT